MQGRAAFLAGVAAVTLAGPALAQEAAPAAPVEAQVGAPLSPLLVIEPDRLFAGSRYGRAVQARLKAQGDALEAENRRIEADLEAEEKRLTDRRPNLPPEEFRALAEEFDQKVEGIRNAQDAKARALNLEADTARETFFATALPALAGLMQERGAVAILDRKAVLASFDVIDVTDDAITRIDVVLGEGPSAVAEDAPADAAPESPPEAAPESAPADGPAPNAP